MTWTELMPGGPGIPPGLTLGDCEAVWEFLGIEAPCGRPAAARIRRICVHEHVRDGWLCPDHAETPQNGLCRTCHDLPGDLSHECPISTMEVTS